MIKNRKNPGLFLSPSHEGAPANSTAQKLVLVLFLTLLTAGAGFALDFKTVIDKLDTYRNFWGIRV